MKLKTLAALLVLPLLAACAPEIEATILVNDIEQAVTAGSSKSVPAILRVPQGSSDGCTENLQRLIDNLSTLAPVTGKGQCIEKDGDNLAEIETGMVIAAAGAPVDERSLFVLTATPNEDDLVYTLTFGLTRTLDEVVKVLATDSNEIQAEFDPAKFIFKLTNDADWAIYVRGQTVFFDGRLALPEMDPPTLQPQSSIEIVFSDVASVHAEAGNAYHFATLYLPL